MANFQSEDAKAVTRLLAGRDPGWALSEFRERRLNHEAARKYTIVDDDGNEYNAGLWRDNTADVLEELSDAHNIANIGLRRYIKDVSQFDVDVFAAYSRLIKSI